MLDQQPKEKKMKFFFCIRLLVAFCLAWLGWLDALVRDGRAVWENHSKCSQGDQTYIPFG
jgi:hypothetical protein